MGRKTPVDKHTEGERLGVGFAMMYREEDPRVGHPEKGMRQRDPDPEACPKRSEFVEKVLARIRARSVAKAPAALESVEERVG